MRLRLGQLFIADTYWILEQVWHIPCLCKDFARVATFQLLVVAPCLGCRVQLPALDTCPPLGVQSAGTACNKCKTSSTTEASCEATCPVRPLDHHLVEKITPLTVLRHSQESCTDDCRPTMPCFPSTQQADGGFVTGFSQPNFLQRDD